MNGCWLDASVPGGGSKSSDDGSSHTCHLPEDLDVNQTTFAAPDLAVFCRLNELGLVAVGQRLDPDQTVIKCCFAEPDPWCRGCGSDGSVSRRAVARRRPR